ncbi:MAG: hypothetical protein II557_06815 [Clostridia bacterium]|nr:hypothetical protein [Clostridia bacterium]
MTKPDMTRLPAAFRAEYRQHILVRILASAVLFAAAGFLCTRIDFTNLRYPAMGIAMVFAVAAVLACVLFRLHLLFRPSWQGTVTEVGAFERIRSTGTRGQPGRRTMVEVTVDRGEKKPYLLSLFRSDKIANGSARVNLFQTHAPYKEGDTLVYLRGLRYPARIGVADADELFEPEYVCPFCGEFYTRDRKTCYKCGKTLLF